MKLALLLIFIVLPFVLTGCALSYETKGGSKITFSVEDSKTIRGFTR